MIFKREFNFSDSFFSVTRCDISVTLHKKFAFKKKEPIDHTSSKSNTQYPDIVYLSLIGSHRKYHLTWAYSPSTCSVNPLNPLLHHINQTHHKVTWLFYLEQKSCWYKKLTYQIFCCYMITCWLLFTRLSKLWYAVTFSMQNI